MTREDVDYLKGLYPPRGTWESPIDFMRRTLIAHRASHQYWVDEINAGGEAPEIGVGNLEIQEYDVARYNSLLAALDEIEALLGRPEGGRHS